MKQLDNIEFTEEFGDKLWFELKKELGKEPTQYEYDNYIDKKYEEYLDTLN